MNIVPFIIYDANGSILRTGTSPESMVAIQAQTGESTLIGQADDRLHYVVNGEVVLKPAIKGRLDRTTIQAGGTDTATISALPNPCIVTIEGNSTIVTDGTAEITLDAPGTYEVTVSALNRLDQTFTIMAI